MNTRTVYWSLIAGLAFLLFPSTSFADTPHEKYHVKFEDMSKDALKNVIGALTLASCPKEAANLRTYSKGKQGFGYNRDIGIDKETTPVSNYSYHPPVWPNVLRNYRYPVVDTSGEFLRIVYEPKKNLRAWVNFEEVKQTAGVSVAMFDSLESLKSFFVDIFYFTHGGKRKVYEKPERRAEFRVISRREKGWRVQRVIELKDEFIRVGNIHMDYEADEMTIEPVGWVRIWDDEGRLTIWIKKIDL